MSKEVRKAEGENKGTWPVRPGINGAVLKWVAIITMLIDHFGAAVFVIFTSYYRMGGQEAFLHADLIYKILRSIGRTAFPIFCFLMVEGFFHTKHLERYIGRMFLFCILSEIPFDLAIYDNWYDFKSQNVYWTLLLGLLAMTMMEWAKKRMSQKTVSEEKSAGSNLFMQRLVLIGIAFLFILIAYLMQTDYDMSGVALILIFYLFYQEKETKLIVGYLSMIWEYWCFPGFILMYFYNGKRGRQPKYFFYLFYPCHLLLLYLLRIYLLKQ